jgi:hypothetical protein
MKPAHEFGTPHTRQHIMPPAELGTWRGVARLWLLVRRSPYHRVLRAPPHPHAE